MSKLKKINSHESEYLTYLIDQTIKKRGSQLVASATGANAFRKPGQTWAYFVKVLGKWKVSKVESIEQRNMAIHTEILIHEQNMTDKIGYFNAKKTRIK